MRVAVVGAGMAGLACAEALVTGGAQVVLFDKGRAPGGRMSTRRVDTSLGTVGFDHGAQYFAARDPAFLVRVEAWHAAGLAAPWPAAGDDAWVGTPGMSSPVRQMAAALDVRAPVTVGGVTRDGAGWLVEGERFDAAVVALPAEQAASVLRPWRPGFAALAEETRSAPCWTLMAAFAERLPVEADVLRGDGPVAWAARNSAKLGRAGPEAWVVQAGPEWSRDNLELEASVAAPLLLRGFADRVGLPLPEPAGAVAHRWRYARSGAAARSMLWDGEMRLGACGDWLVGPRVEAAWLSGTRLAAGMAIAAAASAGPSGRAGAHGQDIG